MNDASDPGPINDMSELPGDPVAALRDEVAAMRVRDMDDAIEFLSLAGRLAALGESEPLADWRRRLTIDARAPIELAAILTEQVTIGLAELPDLDGELLAWAIVEAQDLLCALECDESLRTECGRSGIATRLESWWEAIDETALDDEAAATLRRWLASFPIPDEFRLAVMIDPTGEAEDRLLIEASPHDPPLVVRSVPDFETSAQWRIAGESPLALAASSGPASDEECRRIARHAAFKRPDGGDVHVRLWMERDRTLRVCVTGGVIPDAVGIAGAPLDRGFVDATRAESVWSISIAGWPWRERSDLVRGTVRLRYGDGFRVAIE